MLVALATAIALAAIAWRLRLLTASGGIAAALVGAASIAGGTGWVALLLAFFLSSSILSHWRRAERERLTASVVAKGDRRDAMQVLANGGAFAIAAVASALGSSGSWHAFGAGALAAATADTWSTEVGTVAGGEPRSIVSGRPLEQGMSGGITLVGTAAGAAGAVGVAAIACLLRWPTPVGAVITGGLAGGVLDSVLGATLQERRWCTHCDRATERRVHHCGNPTERRGGLPYFDNDLVNLTSVLAGGVVTWVLS